MTRTAAKLVCILAALTLAASPSSARPRFGVVVGPQLTQLTRVGDDLNHVSTPSRVDWQRTGFGGVTAVLPLRGRFALATGLEYGEFADHEHWSIFASGGGSPLVGESHRQLRVRYASLPVRVEWRPGPWRLGAGPEVRYLLRADERWSAVPLAPAAPQGIAAARGRVAGPSAVIFEEVALDRWFDATELFNRWTLAAQLSAGREFLLGRHALRVDARLSHGITDQTGAGTSVQRTESAQLALGFLW